MKPIEFTKEERAAIVARIQTHFSEELEQSIGVLPAEMLLDFFGREIGGFFYNRGLRDAQAVVSAKAEDVADAIYGLERAEPR